MQNAKWDLQQRKIFQEVRKSFIAKYVYTQEIWLATGAFSAEESTDIWASFSVNNDLTIFMVLILMDMVIMIRHNVAKSCAKILQ